jgi:hypothetical protein
MGQAGVSGRTPDSPKWAMSQHPATCYARRETNSADFPTEYTMPDLQSHEANGLSEATGQAEVTVHVPLPRHVHDRLMARVQKIDTSIGEWITTLIIEALERPESPARLTTLDEVPVPVEVATD